MNRRKFLASIAASAAVPAVLAEEKAETMIITDSEPVASWPESGLAQRGDSLMQMTAHEYVEWRADHFHGHKIVDSK